MKGQLGDKVRIQHVLDAIGEVESYLKGVEYEAFIQNSEKRFATIKQIEIIGEACNAISQKIKDTNSGIPWKAIKGFRNISIHEYFGVNLRIIWDIAQYDLPPMKEQLQNILKTLI
ncbi:DUF86 domain-containing protein [Parapedobacter defluvii]|uniref:DUF86 domain-containing protein n=1 Tax=Parapedobacter defluvii TaxID=2045106 RepID=A0ABQ1LLK9_9SPHI|nr:DUF86 domain-containing protein [Parapedobacter defluvii]GGC24417.1 DUF86 domain-containing protein [Parapedobacter defluvii]